MTTDSQLIDAFSKGLEIREKELMLARKLLDRSKELLENYNKIVNIEALKEAHLENVKNFLSKE